MSTITTLNTTDSGATSRTTLNTNFTNLNADKQEKGAGVTGHIAGFGASNVLSDLGAMPVGTIVGTSDTQVLTNKTITAPAISTPTLTGVTTFNGTYAGSMVIPVSAGGTGASTLAVHGVLIGNGSSTPNATATGTAGQVLTSNGPSLDPTFQTAFTPTITSNFTTGANVTAGQPVYVGNYQSDGGVKLDINGQVSGTSTSLVGNISIAANANRVFVAFVHLSGGLSVSTATLGGTALTQIDLLSPGSIKSYAYILVNPPSGTPQLVLTFSGSATYAVNYAVYYNASASQPDAHTAVTGNSLSLATVANGSLIVSGAVTATGTPGGTAKFANFVTSATGSIADSGQIFPGGTSVTWSGFSGGTSDLFMISLAPATAPVVSVSPTSTIVPTNTQFADAYSGFVGFATTTQTTGNTVSVLLSGIITGLSNLAVGKPYYLADSAGTIATTVGTNTRKCGIATSATSLLVTNIW